MFQYRPVVLEVLFKPGGLGLGVGAPDKDGVERLDGAKRSQPLLDALVLRCLRSSLACSCSLTFFPTTLASSLLTSSTGGLSLDVFLLFFIVVFVVRKRLEVVIVVAAAVARRGCVLIEGRVLDAVHADQRLSSMPIPLRSVLTKLRLHRLLSCSALGQQLHQLRCAGL